MSLPIRILSIALPTPLRRSFDYGLDSPEAPPHLIGCRVEVNFRNQILTGFVVSEKQQTDIPQDKLKYISRLIDYSPLLTPQTLQLLKWAATYYHHSLGEVFHAAIPKHLRKGLPFTAQETQTVLALTNEGLGLPNTALKRAPKQQDIVHYLLDNPSLSNEQFKALNFSTAALKTLKDKNLVHTFEADITEKATSTNEKTLFKNAPLQLNDEQQKAVASLTLNTFQCLLLEGITGSGKTEVYMHWVAKALKEGKQALVLIPEIGLCPQTIKRFSDRFNVPIAQLHSSVSEKKRESYWRQAKNGTAKIIIGTRLAALCECHNLGLIIVDEEHDLSYKQHDGFRYSARDLVVYRASQLAIPVALGSATPALESFNNALNKRYTHIKLNHRASNAAKPSIIINDIRDQPLQAGLSANTLEHINNTLKSGYQVLVFLNRRGFAPSLHCTACGWISTCTGCEMAMTYHNQPRHLHCHRCDRQHAIPRQCPSCKSQQFSTKGLGTEQIESVLAQTFNTTPVVRIDRDTTQTKEAMQTLLAVADNNQPCILIGTQMLAKGHHLPKVNLAVIVDVDQALMSPDFRAIEHVGQLLTQVAGRAGRASQDGKVIIQTLQPEHPILNTLVSQGYNTFAHALLLQRQAQHLPPFGYFALIRAEAKHGANAIAFLQQVKQQVNGYRGQMQVQTIGPIAAPIEKIGHRYRFQYHIYSPSRKQLHVLLQHVIAQVENTGEARRSRWSIDIDPISCA